MLLRRAEARPKPPKARRTRAGSKPVRCGFIRKQGCVDNVSAGESERDLRTTAHEIHRLLTGNRRNYAFLSRISARDLIDLVWTGACA